MCLHMTFTYITGTVIGESTKYSVEKCNSQLIVDLLTSNCCAGLEPRFAFNYATVSWERMCYHTICNVKAILGKNPLKVQSLLKYTLLWLCGWYFVSFSGCFLICSIVHSLISFWGTQILSLVNMHCFNTTRSEFCNDWTISQTTRFWARNTKPL